jgi:glycosyltransferase involved in cell wall biosynthesis
LQVLLPQVRAAGAAVELIVADNCSPDHTLEIVKRAQAKYPFLYQRNDTNLGIAGNLHKLCNEMARGEFAWILGDDDWVLPDGLERVLSVLRRFPEVDYVFVNVAVKHPKERDDYKHLSAAPSLPELLPTKAKDLTERPVERWEELIDPQVDDVFLGAVMCSVFRLSRWRMHTLKCKPGDAPFSSLDITYPHTVTLAHTMIGRRAYYLGYPCTVTFFGEQEWIGYLPSIILVRLQELLDLYLELGVNPEQVRKCREFLLNISTGALKEMLLNPKTPGREYFSLPKFVWRNRHDLRKLSRVLCRIYLSGKLPVPVYEALRSAKKQIL